MKLKHYAHILLISMVTFLFLVLGILVLPQINLSGVINLVKSILGLTAIYYLVLVITYLCIPNDGARHE